MTRLPYLSPADLADGALGAELTPHGGVERPVAVVDLDRVQGWGVAVIEAAREAAATSDCLLVGLTRRATAWAPELTDALALTLTAPNATGGPDPRPLVAVPDPEEALDVLARSVAGSPVAALTVAGLLRLTARLPVREGLVAESLAYSTLLAGPEFRSWRARTPSRPPIPVDDPVLLSRDRDTLRVALNHPQRHNAFGRDMRDGIVEAMRLPALDPTITRVELTGNGRSFCSGGDLDEFGTAPDTASAHLVRLHRNAGAAIHRCADRVTATVHGACIGAGIEVPAFAGRIEARPDAYFQLPELRMGLLPGAGGTVSITRRIGRWRAAYLALSGARLDADTALRWGLVDAKV
ncbi:enoyl-CoA hydratase/isomerase family protein [Nocardiopsis oceani]